MKLSHTKNKVYSRNADIHTTQWSIVIGVCEGSEQERLEALGELCERYWFPVYSFIRNKGHKHFDAEDLAQSFFTAMLHREGFHQVERSKGKFRTFLLSCLENHLTQAWRHSSAQCRAPEKPLISLDLEQGREMYEAISDDTAGPTQLWDRQWAESVISNVMQRLEREFRAVGKYDQFEVLRPLLSSGKKVPYKEVGQRLGMGLNSVKTTIYRLRQRYARAFREEIACTLIDDGDVDDEIAELLNSLR